MRDLRGASVVITGASSGIGRATAIAFARRGACVTLAARREAVLREAAGACEGEGDRALAVLTEVGDPEAVRQLARRAIERFEKIDVWINNAGVGAVGAFVETPIEAHDQVVRTNLLGYLHGARAVLPHFIERGAACSSTICRSAPGSRRRLLPRTARANSVCLGSPMRCAPSSH